MTQARDWLPKEAFSEEAVKAGLHDPVASWSSRWFACAPAMISAVRRGEGQVSAAAQALNIQGGQVTLEMAARGKRHLLEALLDVDLSMQPLADGDRRLLDLMAVKVADDLVMRLDQAFGTPASDRAGTPIVMTISIQGHDVLDIRVADHALVPLIKAFLGTARASLPPPSRRSEALRRMPVKARGVVGKAELQIGDFRELGVGDVLVLDRALGEPVELRLADSGARIASGKLRRSAGHVSIQL